MAPPDETMPKALTAARRAVKLDPNLAEGHCALAMALLLWERDYAAADAAFKRCLEINPEYTQGRAWYALFDLQMVHGRLEEGVAEARKTLAADPLSAYATAILAFALGLAGYTAEALETARLSAQRDPDSLLTHWVHALAAHWHGGFEESIAAYTTAAAVSGRHPFTLVYAAAAYADWGRPADARLLHNEMLALGKQAYVPRSTLAVSAAAVGDMELALDLAEEACDEREPALIILSRIFRGWNLLRQHPRFAEVRLRLALP
jgi:tetratricopeptide (TPR) repeat protein